MQPQQSVARRKLRIPLVRGLNATSATLIFFSYPIIIFLFGFGVFALGMVLGGAADSDRMTWFHDKIMPILSFILPIAGGSVAMLLAYRLIPEQLFEAGPCGAALALGSRISLLCGYLGGLAIPSCTYVIWRLTHFQQHWRVSDFDRLAMGSGFTRIPWILFAVSIGPFIEEMLVRGIIYGGYRKSFGPFAAAILSTAIFMALHAPDSFQRLPRAANLIVVSLAALWLRLKFRAIGPAVALHCGHNSLATALQLIASDQV